MDKVVLGDCELYLGDCLEVLPTLEAEGFDAIVTDPPYGIDYQSARRTDKTTWKPKIQNDKLPCVNWIQETFRLVIKTGCILCFCRWDTQEAFCSALQDSGWTIKSQVIWDRKVHGMGDLEGAFAPQHDIIWFGTSNGFQFPSKRPSSIVSCMRISAESLVHPNEKPVPLIKYLVYHVTSISQTVLDPFMGSGTTGVACVQTGRKFVGIEIEPEYFDIAVKRIQEAQMQLRLF